MIRIQTKPGVVEEIDAEATARGIVDGRLTRLMIAEDPLHTVEPACLEEVIGHAHCRFVSRALLDSVAKMVLPGQPVLPHWLRQRATDLLEWKWPLPEGPLLVQRLTWLVAWTAGLEDHADVAIRWYTRYLQQESIEPHLRQVALNNVGVHRIRFASSADGIVDLARAAIRMDPSDGAGSMKPLPAAGFNLRQLLVKAWRVPPLLKQVDRSLAAYMAKLPPADRETWTGEPRLAASDSSEPSWRYGGLIEGRPDRYARILKNLNPKGIHPRSAWQDILPNGSFVPERAADELRLWEVAGEPQSDADGGRSAKPEEWSPRSYAGAAELLEDSHIPPILVETETDLAHPARMARDKITQGQRLLDQGSVEAAALAVTMAMQVIEALEDGAEREGLRNRATGLLRECEDRAKRRRLLDLSQTLEHLTELVEGVLAQRDPCKVHQAAREAVAAAAAARKKLVSECGEEMGPLVDDYQKRIEQHVSDVSLADIRARVKAPYDEFMNLRPQSWTDPVDSEAYVALGRCHAADPRCQVHNYVDLRQQLDHHQARYFLDQVLHKVLDSNNVCWDDVEPLLAQAMVLDSELAAILGPMINLIRHPPQTPEPARLSEIRQSITQQVKDLLAEKPMGVEGDAFPAMREVTLGRGAQLLGRLVASFLDVQGDVKEMGQTLQQAYGKVLQQGTPAQLEVIQRVLEQYLRACPRVNGGQWMPPDPRNPIQALLGQIQRTRLLAVAEIELDAQTPNAPKAAEAFGRAMAMGLDDAEQFCRAARGLAIVRVPPQVPTSVRTAVMEGLEAWGNAMPPADRARQDAAGVAVKIDALLTDLGFGPPPAAPEPPSGDVPSDAPSSDGPPQPGPTASQAESIVWAEQAPPDENVDRDDSEEPDAGESDGPKDRPGDGSGDGSDDQTPPPAGDNRETPV